jgi:predicted nucleotidyltransferase
MPTLNELLDHLRAQHAPPSHLVRLTDLVALAGHDPRLLALSLVGSYARGTGDRLSDLDLVAIAAPGAAEAVLQAAQHLLGRAPVLNRFTGRHAAGGRFCKLVFLDFSSVEFHVFEPDTAFRLKRPWLPVWDPSQLLPGYVVDGEPIGHQDFAAYEHGDEGLIWELVDCIKWLSRGRQGLARHHLRKIATEMARRESEATAVDPAPGRREGQGPART